jgi:hypothetical protein
MARTALSGAWLGVFGTAMLLAARSADILHSGAANFTSSMFTASWWLTVTIVLNMFLLCPAVVLRAYRAKKICTKKSEIADADLAVIISVLLFTFSGVFLSLSAVI